MNAEKAIIVAAGQGVRLRPHTDDRPKCLVSIGGRTILERALGAFQDAGIRDIVVIRGYRGDLLRSPSYRTVDNPDFARNNVLESLFCAGEEMRGGFIFSYADIVFGPEVMEPLMRTGGDIVLVVDRQWKRAYEGRDLRPETGAELVTAKDGRVTGIGVGTVPLDEAFGEFIGIAKFTARGAELLRDAYAALRGEYADDPNRTFRGGRSFRKAYLTDLFQHMIDRGVRVDMVPIAGGWREIDTVQDLERAQAALSESWNATLV